MFDDIQIEEQATERPPLRALTYVNPQRFAPRHLALLERLCAYAWEPTDVKQLAARIYWGDLWLFEAREPDAIFLLSLSAFNGNETGSLNIEGVAGDGVMARAEDFKADLRTIQREYSAERIVAVTARTGWDALGEKMGFIPKATIWHMEVEDGRQRSEEHDDDAEGGAVGQR